jgi:serine/threonine-protein kinase
MSTQHDRDTDQEDIVRIDRSADAFEEVWRQGRRPSIEDHLGDASGRYRLALVRELLLIEWQRRLRLGEHPVPREYAHRFPELAAWISEAIRERDGHQGTTVDCEPPALPAADELPYLSDYELLERIGGGGMGVVYRARKRSRLDGGDVALKMIAEHRLSGENLESFLIEMRNQARLQHPHIVQVLDSGQDGGRPFFTMIFYRGSDLAHVLKKHGPLEPATSALYVSRIAWAVQHLHSQQDPLLHRDVKPQNILLDHYSDRGFPFGRPYLADLGLVRLLEETSPGFTRGALEGTIPYMAPEQVEGRKVVPASDVWALGVILFECLTGRAPFRGETQAEIIYQIRRQETPSPRAIRPAIPRELERICLKCLKKPLESRYRSALELIEDLDCFFERKPLIHAQPEGPWERVVQWAARAPALAVRLAVIFACSAIIWGHRWVNGRFRPTERDHPVVNLILSRLGYSAGDPATTAVLIWANQVILIAWGLISWVFQRQVARSQTEDRLQLLWRIADITVLCLLIVLDDAVMSPLTVAFAVLIVASAFSARAGHILQTMLLSMAGYSLLAWFHQVMHPAADHVYRHLHYLAGLTLLGLMLTYQANRTRALARICGTRDRA